MSSAYSYKMQAVTTLDGSETFFNEKVREHYHSITGAKEESLLKFAMPALKVIHNKRTVRVLDVCFGLGYNTAAVIDAFKGFNPDMRLRITAIEIDPEIISKIETVKPEFKHYDWVQNLAKKKTFAKNDVEIELLVGDALEILPSLRKHFDVILHDPFSPKKAPELWTQEFFAEIARLTASGGVLTTYSCAKSMRRNLEAVGFTVSDGPSIGRRSPSTIAVKQ